MSESQMYKVELRDLPSVIRHHLPPGMEVLDYNTEPLLPVGENYGSTILKVRARLAGSDGKVVEELHLVAKMQPETELQRQMFDSPFTFNKERFFYMYLLPAYQQLEREFGIEEVLDLAPKFYGARMNSSDLSDDVDEDAVILMQNLKVLGYYTVDRRKGMDEAHVRQTISVLARFHALGIAMKTHKPDFFCTVKEYCKCLKFEIDEADVEEMQAFLALLRDDPITMPYYSQIEAAMMQDVHELWESPATEPWSTVTHMDLWVNNIMFRKDEISGKIDVKFVDFQNYLFMSPLRELVFFVMLNFELDLMEHKFDEMLDLYYEQFIDTLKRMKCDIEPFRRDKFDERLKIDAVLEFPHCPFMTKVTTNELKENGEAVDLIQDVLKSVTISPLFMERMRMYVRKYAEKGWFTKSEP